MTNIDFKVARNSGKSNKINIENVIKKELIALLARFEESLPQESTPNKSDFARYSGYIAINLLKLYLFYNYKFTNKDYFWFHLSRSFGEDFGTSDVYDNYLKLVDFLTTNKIIL